MKVMDLGGSGRVKFEIHIVDGHFALLAVKASVVMRQSPVAEIAEAARLAKSWRQELAEG